MSNGLMRLPTAAEMDVWESVNRDVRQGDLVWFLSGRDPVSQALEEVGLDLAFNWINLRLYMEISAQRWTVSDLSLGVVADTHDGDTVTVIDAATGDAYPWACRQLVIPLKFNEIMQTLNVPTKGE